MEIKDYLRNHLAISPSWIEKQLKLPKGTIRITTDRAIPEKYREGIISLLKDYGWDYNDSAKCDNKDNKTIANVHSTAVRDTSNINDPISTNPVYYTRKNKNNYYEILTDEIRKNWKNEMAPFPIRVNDIPDGSIVIIKDK